MPSDMSTNGSNDPNTISLLDGAKTVQFNRLPESVKIEAVRRAFSLPSTALASGIVNGTIDAEQLIGEVTKHACRKQFSHVLSNEVSSRLKNVREARAESEEGPFTDDELEQEKENMINDFIEAFYSGEWGTATRGPSGPRVPPIEAEFNRIARLNAKAAMDEKVKSLRNGKYNAKSKTWTWEAKGADHSLTLDKAIELYLGNAQYGEARRAQCQAQAEASLAVKEREAAMRKSTMAETVAVDATTAEELNL